MKTYTLIIENDEFAEILRGMLEQMQFVRIRSEQSPTPINEPLTLQTIIELEKEPVWDATSIERNYKFNRDAIVGKLDCKETAEELISLLSA